MKIPPYPSYLMRVFVPGEYPTLYVAQEANRLLQSLEPEAKVIGGGTVAMVRQKRTPVKAAAVVMANELLRCVEHRSGNPPQAILPSQRAKHEAAIKRLRELGYKGRDPEYIYAWPDIVLITLWPSNTVGVIVAAHGEDAVKDGVVTGLKYTALHSYECLDEENDDETVKKF